MRLTKLEIYGFKSFAKRTEIVFPQNVTGIVGPNGSGKSNIADAVRWVLGEQSAKNLRGNSMADVIFNGTEQKKPMNYCEVTLVFDNGDHQLPVEYGEVSITRRVYRSGEGEYLLNGGNCRLKDIVDLFRDTGVGKEGYSIIGQGRIDEILSQRGEDRRAVFEEAAGISRFRTRKEDAETRMRHADENLVRVTDVLEELESHLAPLERQASVARQYLELSEQLKELDVRLFLCRYGKLHDKEIAADQAYLSIQDALNEAETLLADAVKRREEGQRELENLQNALEQAHDGLLKANDNLHAVKESVTATDTRMKNGGETAERLNGEMESLRDRMKLIQLTMTQSDGGLGEAENLLSKAQEALEDRKSAHAAATAKAQDLEDELTRHNAEMMERMNRVQSTRANQARQSAMGQQMRERRAELEKQQAGEMEREEALSRALAAAKENLAAEEERLTGLQTAAAGLEQSAKDLLQAILSKQREAQEEAQNARATDARLRMLKELKESYEGYQYPVKNALSYAKKERMAGVRDVVAMLLHVPKEYETAVNMALGNAMQDVVTDTEEEAKRLIQYLRQNSMGRATFLPISSVRGRTLSPSERRLLSMEGCLGVASELCAYEEAYRGIMENLLGRTVLARDLDSGVKIMRAGNQAFRLVTLQGDVMNPGGSITGGSVQHKAQNLLGRERELKELEEALRQANDKAIAAQAEVTALESRRAGEKERRESAQYELHQQEIAVVRDTEHLKTAENEWAAHRERMESLTGALEQIDESLRDVEAELKRMEGQASEQDGSMDELNARTVELSALLNTARREREATQEALTDAMLTVQNAENDCDSIRKDQKRLIGDQENCAKEIAALLQKREQALLDVAAAAKEKEEQSLLLAAAEANVERAKAKVDDTEARRDLRQRELRDVQTEIDGAQQLTVRESERLHRQELAQAKVKNDLSVLSERLWSTYEMSYAGAQELYNSYPPLEAPFKEGEADEQASSIRNRIKEMGTVNVGAIEEFAQMKERHTGLLAQRNDLEQAKQDLRALIEQLLERMETVFTSQFSLLQGYFSETFRRLFGGGSGEIFLSNPDDPLNCGIEIIVQPPGKKRQLLSLFSGGERALTAIAILFAMLKLKPTPFCILDEIEAALDDANIAYFADYLKEFSRDTQFIVVTHRKGTMERCDSLFGVAMEERGVSSMVSVNLTDYDEA